MSEQAFRNLISRKSGGLLSSAARGVLRLLSMPYSVLMQLRNAAYDLGLSRIHAVRVPVIAVGNLTTGGTGKTPIVATIVQLLQAQGHRPGIVSRGYKADDTGENDEKRVLSLLCPNVPHEQNPNRVAAAERLLADENVDVIVLDDAFQHRRIARDLNILLIDATNPFGYGYQLPRGLLREPLRSLKRADLVLITRTDQVTVRELQQVESTLRLHMKNQNERIYRVSFSPTGLLSQSGQHRPLASVENQPVVVLTAIGNPEAFVNTCIRIGADVVTSLFFADHHQYTPIDLERIQQHAQMSGAPTILTTLKDLVKIPDGHENILAVQIETLFPSESAEQAVRNELHDVMRSGSPDDRP